MTVDQIPVHEWLAPADVRYNDLEVDPWPHIHVASDEDDRDQPIVRVRLVRYKGWPIYTPDREAREQVDRWTITVRRPGQLVRLLSLGRVTFEGRVDDAIETLRERWDDLVEERLAAWLVAGTYADRDRPNGGAR